jgi:hypothetical protein
VSAINPAVLATPSQVRTFEAAVSDPMFWPWLAEHARAWAGNDGVTPGTPWHAWLLRAASLADDLPVLRRTPASTP